jgi:ATP-dependent DNA helicase PIF1
MKKPSSAYSILLLYSDWGSKGEVGILNDMPDPQSRLQEIFSTLPDYVQKSIKVIQSSEERLADTGNPDEQPTGNIDADEAQREFTEHLHDFDGISMEDINNPYRNVEQKPLGDQIIKPVTYNCSHSTMSYLYNFVDSLKSDWKNTPALDHCLTETEIAAGVRVAVSDHEAKEELLHTKYLSRFSALQMKAFSTFRDAVANVSSEQVVMVLSGEGGTGKSDVINAISIQTSLIVGKVNGRRGACIRMAPTGSAAFNIHGSTWQSCLEKGRDGYQSIKDVNINHQLSLERAFGGTIVVIIDEISMLSAENLIEISERYVII